MTVIIIMRVQEEMAAASGAEEAPQRAEEASAETQRTLLIAERYAARTREEMGGQSFMDFLRHLGGADR